VSAIAHPALLTLADAIRLANAAAPLDNLLDLKILSNMTNSPRNWPHDIPRGEMMRALQVIDTISDCRRLAIPLAKFLKLPNRYLRSKAVKLVARASRNPGWADSILYDTDARVRANMIEGLAEQIGKTAEPLLRKAARDWHHRVATTALLELARWGDSSCRESLERMLSEGDEPHRRAAAWALDQLAKTTPPQPKPEPQAPEPDKEDEGGEDE